MNGRIISHYRIGRELGSGGMGEVYLADDLKLQRKVALKLLPAQFTSDRERVLRFHQEARAASALTHPNIITIYEIGEAEERHYIATEYIDGETLRERIARRPMTVVEVLDVAIAVANALVAAHDAGIIHRDIKPENVMLRRDGIVKVLDFGLAKLTERTGVAGRPKSSHPSTDPGLVMGTVHYMSPEQLRGEVVDARTDLFSLGEVIYEMVAGNSPFDGPSTSEVIAAILERLPAPLTRFARNVPEQLERIVTKSLQKDRDRRYQSAREIYNDLTQLRDDLVFSARQNRIATDPLLVREPARADGVFDRVTDPLLLSSDGARMMPRGPETAPLVRRVRANKDLVFGLLLLLAIVIGAFAWFSRPQRTYDSIAVLPFQNVNRDAGSDYLSDGIAESIIHSLSQLPQLQVMAMSSVSRYKSHSSDPRAVGKELNVDTVLTGKIQQRGDTLVIQADLVDVDRGTLLWGEQYNRPRSDLLVVQSEIAQEISEKLRLRLSGAERARLARRHTDDEEAYRLYLLGRHQWNKRTAEGLQNAVTFFNQAIEREPTYALAYAGLADCYSLMPVYGLPISPQESFARSKAAAKKALELDDTLAEAHTSLAWAYFNSDWQWKSAEEEFQRAIALNPSYATAHHWYALYLSAMGRHSDARHEIQKALELDPLSMAINTAVGTIEYLGGRFDAAMAQFKKTNELEPGFPRGRFEMARLQELTGLCSNAIPSLEELSATKQPSYQLGLARAYAKCGRVAEARKIVDDIVARRGQTYINPYDIAAVFAAASDREHFYQWLEVAYREHVTRLAYLNVEPMFAEYRGDAEFVALTKRIGLPPAAERQAGR